MDLGGLLDLGRDSGENLGAIACKRGIDSLPVDQLLGPLGGFTVHDDSPVPSLGIHGPQGLRSRMVTYDSIRKGNIGSPNRSATALWLANRPIGRRC
jgi:hypothetical protein